MIIKWILSIGYANADREGEFEIEDDATEEEIEEVAKDYVYECLDWNWEKSE